MELDERKLNSAEKLLDCLRKEENLSRKGARTLKALIDRIAEEKAGAPTSLWTIEDVATRLNVSKRKVYDLLEKDEITSIRVGRQHRFEPKAIEAYLKRQA